ncbi:hypothetical protein BACFRA24663_09055 [Bacteroides fragilis]
MNRFAGQGVGFRFSNFPQSKYRIIVSKIVLGILVCTHGKSLISPLYTLFQTSLILSKFIFLYSQSRTNIPN